MNFHTSFISSTVSPVIAMSPAVLSVIEDQQVVLPCVLLAGNPLPERQWLHNYGLVRTRTVKFRVFNVLNANNVGLIQTSFICDPSVDVGPVFNSEEGRQSKY